MQIDQRRAAQTLQRDLNLRLQHLELASCAGDPDKALWWQFGGQGVSFADTLLVWIDIEDAHRAPRQRFY